MNKHLKPISPGTYTALITPFTEEKIDKNGLKQLIDFQIENGVTGILSVGTTGESPILTWDEHVAVIYDTANKCKNKCACLAGAGSNDLREAVRATMHASKVVNAVLIVDPYYNGPSSLEIRREYYEPLAKEYPGIQIIPYIIPGRTGTKLLPEDLAILSREYPNISAIKDATGDLDNMKRTRKYCGPNLQIFSGDDDKTYTTMTDPEIMACGVISVISNIAPRAISTMVQLALNKKKYEAERITKDLQPLFDIVTVVTDEITPDGIVKCKARNPLPIKTLMAILGLPSGPCRPPLGKMTINGIKKIVAAATHVLENSPYIFSPIIDFFNVDIRDRLENSNYLKGLYYSNYF